MGTKPQLMKPMMSLQAAFEPVPDFTFDCLPSPCHATFQVVYEQLIRWCNRFRFLIDTTVSNDFMLFYLLAERRFLDHRGAHHLFRLILSAHMMQKKLFLATTNSSELRHIEVKWMKAELVFPFTGNRPVLGCLVGFNLLDRYEIFDEENVLLALKKHIPEVQLVQESVYSHTSSHDNLKLFYFEIEKKDRTPFSLNETKFLQTLFEEKVEKSIQALSPTIFMNSNDEEIYKNALILGREIKTLTDIPQVSILLDSQTNTDVVFRVTIVYIAPLYSFSFDSSFFGSPLVPEKMVVVNHIDQHPIEAHIFRLHLPRESLLLRTDGSLDFYAARHKAVTVIESIIGEFRDYNGGILVTQQELLHALKTEFAIDSQSEHEHVEAFFYAITPLEKQLTLQHETLFSLYRHFQEERKKELPQEAYSCKIFEKDVGIYLVVHADEPSILQMILDNLQKLSLLGQDIIYNTMHTAEGAFFNAIIPYAQGKEQFFIEAIQDTCHKWYQEKNRLQVLRIAIDTSVVSLDPRIGGERSVEVLKLLFEGLTRYDSQGKIENGMAEHIEISPDLKEYIFRLRPALWNDGSPVTAHDFEYAWKKTLAPDFSTSFAHFLYPIKNARTAKEGKMSADQIGIQVVDERTLKVTLDKPIPYFLQMTAHPIYSPVRRSIDQQSPHWTYEADKAYPCNGPFQLERNQPSQGFHLVKNPLYWDASQVTLNQVTLTVMHPSQAVQAFEKDEVDWIGNPFGGWYSAYEQEEKKNQQASSLFFPDCWTSWCVFNTARLPFNHPKFRQAFAYAIEREQLIEAVDPAFTPAHSILLPHYHRNKTNFFPEYSLEKARKLFNETLKILHIGMEDCSQFTLICEENAIHVRTAEYLKKQFEGTFGIRCTIEPYPWNVLFHKMTHKQFHIGLMNWTSWIDDAAYTLNTFKFANQKLNFASWENAQYQQLLDLSEQQINPFQRSTFQLKAEMILGEETPLVPLYHRPSQAVIKSNLHIAWKKPCGPLNLAKTFYKQKRV